MMFDVKKHLDRLHTDMPEVRLYALVDGVHYQSRFYKPLVDANGFFPLFAGTPDAALSHAGPWLVDISGEGRHVVNDLVTLELELPAVSWLTASQDLIGMAQLLQLRMDARLPDGRIALLRFWDPRVFAVVTRTLDERQREEFFHYIHEWYLLLDGRRVTIGRPNASAL
jgi:hypothetical protein